MTLPAALETQPTGAMFSADRVYRYLLWRRLDGDLATVPHRGPLLCVLLNPSTADETDDDPTVARMRRRAWSWGHDALVVCNAYAVRATDPAAIRRHPEPVGADNDAYIRAAARRAAFVICGWGRHCGRERERTLLNLIRNAGRTPHALKILSSGTPGHPLYVHYNVQPRAIPLPAPGTTP